MSDKILGGPDYYECEVNPNYFWFLPEVFCSCFCSYL